jgi:glycosyltransferase involved in cell wall biosynthesis
MDKTKFFYSVIIPVYNSEKIVGQTVNSIIAFFEKKDLTYEIILVNDGSPDNSWHVIKQLSKENKNVISVNLLKNYGQHTAVFCGLSYANGDYMITMDDDMQNPPEEIIHLIDKVCEGYDLVFGKFKEKKHNWVRRMGSKVIGYLNYKIFNKPSDITLTNFRIIKRDVVDRMLDYKTNYPYIPGLVLLFSSKIANVEVEHNARPVGSSNYTAIKIIKLTSRLLFNYSSYPLRLISMIGIAISIVSFFLGFSFIIRKIFLGVTVPGWTSMVVLLAFFNGFVILLLGLLGEYVSRILNQLSVTKTYYVKEIVNENG